MAIKRADGFSGFLLECDDCGEEEFIECDQEDFAAAVEEAKELGWLSRNVDGEWQNVCPGCRE